MLKDFKEFIMRGSVVDMAIGIVIGAAFGGDCQVFCGRRPDAAYRPAPGKC